MINNSKIMRHIKAITIVASLWFLVHSCYFRLLLLLSINFIFKSYIDKACSGLFYPLLFYDLITYELNNKVYKFSTVYLELEASIEELSYFFIKEFSYYISVTVSALDLSFVIFDIFYY